MPGAQGRGGTQPLHRGAWRSRPRGAPALHLCKQGTAAICCTRVSAVTRGQFLNLGEEAQTGREGRRAPCFSVSDSWRTCCTLRLPPGRSRSSRSSSSLGGELHGQLQFAVKAAGLTGGAGAQTRAAEEALLDGPALEPEGKKQSPPRASNTHVSQPGTQCPQCHALPVRSVCMRPSISPNWGCRYWYTPARSYPASKGRAKN